MMNPNASVISLAKAAVRSHEAVLVSIRVSLTRHIRDAQIIAASEAAAELYGYDSPGEMEGLYISTLHHLDDILESRKRAIARQFRKRPLTDHYVMRALHRNGTPWHVEKEVQQFSLACDGWEDTVWITRQYPTDQAVDVAVSDVIEDDDHLFGPLNVAQAQLVLDEFLRNGTGEYDNLLQNRAYLPLYQLMPFGGKDTMCCFCKHCDHIWISRSVSVPSRCPQCNDRHYADHPLTKEEFEQKGFKVSYGL